MDLIYSFLESIIPFSWIQYDFMKNALLALILLAPLYAILGTMIVSNGMAFFSDALGHSALSGIALGIMFGANGFSYFSLIFAIVFAVLLNIIKRSGFSSADTVISVFSSLGIALGLVLLSTGGSSISKYQNLLIGDVLSITPDEILYVLIVLAVVLVFWFLFFNRLSAISINPSLAKSKGFNVFLTDTVFVVIISVIVMISIRWVGTLIINALLILPAASSRNISSNLREYHFYSLVFSVFSCISGLIFSYCNNLATGPVIVVILALIFFMTFIFRKRLRADQ